MSENQVVSINDMNINDLRLYSHSIRCKFYEARARLYNYTRSYFNQSIESNYTKESAMSDTIEECIELKELYLEIQKQIRDRKNECVLAEVSS